MMKKVIILICVVMLGAAAGAQPPFIAEGKIEYERRINIWATLEDDRYAEEIRKTMPRFKTDFFELQFKEDKSVYSHKSSDTKGYFGNLTALKNTVYTNWATRQVVAKKNLFEETVVIDDSLRKINWKLTNDFREIAGFSCRRATALIMDSVFVVAFYTDQIEMPGGPEGLAGLPGMILGLVINRLHTSWYATKVEVQKVPRLQPPADGTVWTRKQLKERLQREFPTKTAEQLFNYRNLRL